MRLCFICIAGSFDIKQSLNIKRKQDRSKTLQLPEEADPGTLLTLGQREFKNGNTEIAMLFLTKAKSIIKQHYVDHTH